MSDSGTARTPHARERHLRAVEPISTADAAIAGAVRAEQARRRLSDAEMAEPLGRNQQWYSRRKLGEVPFTAGQVLVLAGFLKMNVADLLPHLDSNQEPAD